MHLHRAVTRLLSLYGRLVGVTVLLYGGWIFAVNVLGVVTVPDYDSLALLLVILGFGLVGFLSAVGFLLTFDGPNSWRITKKRAIAWILMLLSVLLPTSLIVFVVPLVLLAALTILAPPEAAPAPARR